MAVRKLTSYERRKYRTRNKVRAAGLKSGAPRLSVHRTGSGIYAQIIDDRAGVTLAAASTAEKDLKSKLKSKGSNIEAAKLIGSQIAERAKKAGVKNVVFDRGAFLYHGRVKALGDAAREAGLEF
jgi:large subunit ribosomal protein L18